MLSDKQLLIAMRAFASEDRKVSWWHVWSTLLVIAGLLAVVCSDLWWGFRLPFSMLLGLTMVRMFVIFHDFQHGAILRGSWLANGIMNVVGLLLLSPSTGWRRSHNHHHASNSRFPGPDIGTFPLLDVEAYRDSSWRQRGLYVAARHPLTILTGYFSVFFVGMCMMPLFTNPRKHADAALAILFHFSILLWFAFDEVDDLCLAVLLPCTIASAVGAFLFYVQHNFAGARVYRRENWNYTRAALHSSSYVPMGPILRWFVGNIGFHHIHHLNDNIPFYRLPETMAAVSELQSPPTIALSLRNIRECFRQNLWDPATERLVPWSALDAARVQSVQPQEERAA